MYEQICEGLFTYTVAHFEIIYFSYTIVEPSKLALMGLGLLCVYLNISPNLSDIITIFSKPRINCCNPPGKKKVTILLIVRTKIIYALRSNVDGRSQNSN